MICLKPVWLLNSAAVALVLPATVQAQAATPAPAAGGAQLTASAAAADSDEIIVTAQKRSERISDVPVSITAASGEQLTNRGITSPTQLEKIIPGFTFQQTQVGAPVFAIRGIGFFDAQIGASPTVTVYVDQVPLPYSIMTRGATLDLERVEALKGPQGTLFGQNSTGGAINYIAAKPTEEIHASGLLEGGRFAAVNAEAFVTGKIADGLTGRLSGRYEHRDGWQVSQTRPGDKYGKGNFYNGRLLLDWKPSDRLSFELNVNGWKDEAQLSTPQFVGFVPQAPLNPFNGAAYAALSAAIPAPNKARIADFDAARTKPSDSSFYQASLRADWQVTDDINLTSITAYSHYKTVSLADVDGTAFNDLYYQVNGKIRSFSQELRLSGETERLKWLVGGNYQKDRVNEDRVNFLNSTNNGIGPFRYSQILNVSQQDVRSIAGFGNLEFEIIDNVTLQGSARYTDLKRDFSGCLADSGNGQIAAAFGFLSGMLSGSPTTIPAGGCVTLNDNAADTSVPVNKPLPIVNDTLNEHNIAWRGGANWKPDGDTLVYGNVTKGYKSGNYTILPAVFASQLAPVTQESVLAYEVGLKKSFASRTIQFSGAAFYYDYKDKQLLGSVLVPVFGNLPQLVNIPKSRVWGGEIELTARPIAGLRLQGGLTYVNSRVKTDPQNPRNPFGQLISFVGEQFPNTPKWQGLFDAEYEFPLSNTLNVSFGGNVNFRSDSFAQFGELSQFKIDSYALLDLRAGIGAENGRWKVQIWGRNVTNKFYLNGVQRPIDTIIRYAGMPVTYGATLSFRY